jgi:D-alanine-D-alanine ligase
MKGFSRTEFIIVNDEPYMLEMNTVQDDNRKFDSTGDSRRISLEDLFRILSSYLYKKI